MTVLENGPPFSSSSFLLRECATFFTFLNSLVISGGQGSGFSRTVKRVKGRAGTLRGVPAHFWDLRRFLTSLCAVTLCSGIVDRYTPVSWLRAVVLSWERPPFSLPRGLFSSTPRWKLHQPAVSDGVPARVCTRPVYREACTHLPGYQGRHIQGGRREAYTPGREAGRLSRQRFPLS